MSRLDHTELLNNFIIEDVKIFDGHNFIAKGFVVVKDGLITDVGNGKPVETDERDILRISRPQHTLIPGLIDAHIHALEGNTDSVEQSLRFGVTTVCDMHNEIEDINRLKKVGVYFSHPNEHCERLMVDTVGQGNPKLEQICRLQVRWTRSYHRGRMAYAYHEEGT